MSSHGLRVALVTRDKDTHCSQHFQVLHTGELHSKSLQENFDLRDIICKLSLLFSYDKVSSE